MRFAKNDAVSGISVVSVYNDPGVLRDCLESSIEDYCGALNVELVPVDNTSHAFKTAGAALNHGARMARHDRIVFVHQDVYLHSIDHLFKIGDLLIDGSWSLLGANGMTEGTESVGRMRDRVKLIGREAATPIAVDSVDEVAFMALRELVLAHPLTEDPDLAWHAYAVEYGLRLRQLGRKVGAVDLGVTHNSLTINLDRLDVAHQRIANLYPDKLPVRTTCGTIGSIPSKLREVPLIRKHRWRTTWLRQSYQAARVNRLVRVPVVIGDISHDVDLLEYSEESPLHVFNMDDFGAFARFSRIPLPLKRRDRPVIVRTVQTVDELLACLDQLPDRVRILVTDPQFGDLPPVVGGRHAHRDWIVGSQPGALWLVGGPDVHSLPTEWSRSKAVPLWHRSRPSRV